MAVLYIEITSIGVKIVFVFIKCLHLITFETVAMTKPRKELFHAHSVPIYSTDVVHDVI